MRNPNVADGRMTRSKASTSWIGLEEASGAGEVLKHSRRLKQGVFS